MIRAISYLTMAAVLALISGAPAWSVYALVCAVAVVILTSEPKK